jgi:hypothetical protein
MKRQIRVVLKGETIANGAPKTCSECQQEPQLGVYMSAAGYYVGTYCGCGPYSRESGYYGSEKEAAAALAMGDFGRYPTSPHLVQTKSRNVM